MLEVSINVGEEKYKQYFGRRGVNISFIFHAFQTYFKARDTYLRFFFLLRKKGQPMCLGVFLHGTYFCLHVMLALIIEIQNIYKFYDCVYD